MSTHQSTIELGGLDTDIAAHQRPLLNFASRCVSTHQSTIELGGLDTDIAAHQHDNKRTKQYSANGQRPTANSKQQTDNSPSLSVAHYYQLCLQCSYQY